MAQTIVICNWESYQHYKDRGAPWIKLYRDILTTEAWLFGTDASRLVQIASTLLAVRYSNATPMNWGLFRKVASLDITEQEFAKSIEHLSAHNFLKVEGIDEACKQPASTVLASCTSEESRGEESRGRIEHTQTRAREPDFVPRGTSQAIAKIRSLYPEGTYTAADWLTAEHLISVHIDNGVPPEELVAAVGDYAMQAQATGRVGTQYVKNPARHFSGNTWRGPFQLPATKAEVAQDANIATSLRWLKKQEAKDAAV